MPFFDDVVLRESIEIKSTPEMLYGNLTSIVDDASFKTLNANNISFRWLQGDPRSADAIALVEKSFHFLNWRLKMKSINGGLFFKTAFLIAMTLSAGGCAHEMLEPRITSDRPANHLDAPTSELIQLETRRGVTQRFILIKPKNPHATVVLLDGYGDYKMGSFRGRPKIGQFENGTLVRTRSAFAEQGLMVAVVDKPSDKKAHVETIVGMNLEFRISDDHVQDIKAVIAYLKNEADIPVWLVGMCAGAFSAATACINIKEEIDGLILLAAVTTPLNPAVSKLRMNGVLDLDLGAIHVPTLIGYNKDDECPATKPQNANKIEAALINARQVEVALLGGGNKPLSGPCASMSYHGFYGIEAQLVSKIADFIKLNTQ